MNRIILIAAALALGTSALAPSATAQMSHDQMDHGQMDHGNMKHGDDHAHDHAAPAHADHAHDQAALQALRLVRTPEIDAALSVGGDPVVAKILGVVCDFCAKAMNKTFGKRPEVAAVYVDLDSKTLNLVMQPGQSLSDEELHRLVKKSGYKIDSLARGAALTE